MGHHRYALHPIHGHWLWAAALILLFLGSCPRAAGPAAPAVALGAFEIPGGLEDPEAIRATFEPLLIQGLEAAGFSVVPASEAAPIWDEKRRAFGPYFDPITGEEHGERTRAARRAALHDLSARQAVIAWIRPAIETRAAPFEKGKASWDGASEGAKPIGAGEVTGLSVALYLDDAEGETVATGHGGIQLLTKYSSWNSKFMVVERDKLFRNEKKNGAGVTRALDPIVAALRELPPAPAVTEVAPPAPVEEAVAIAPEWPDLAPGTRTLLLREVYVRARNVDVPQVIRERYLDLLRERFAALGWTVVEPSVFDRAYRAAALRWGGIFDPWTGSAIAGRADSALAEARREAAQHVPGAVIVRPVLGTVLAGFKNEKATWDGVTEPVARLSTFTKILVTQSGRTEALSFAVFATDETGREIHARAGGIQLTSKYQGHRFVPVSRESLFADPARDERAVTIALEGFPMP